MDTDVEDVEFRMPVRILQWSLRRGSGGIGAYYGGCGLIKEWLFLEDAEVSLLASRRSIGARGYQGGGKGAVGKDEYTQKGLWKAMPSRIMISAGERCRIQTPGGGGFGKK